MKTMAILLKEDLTEEGQEVFEKNHGGLNHTHLREWNLLDKYDRVAVKKGSGYIIIGDFGAARPQNAGTVIGGIIEFLF